MDIDRVPREVIDAKLLACLDDENKVALVLSEADLLLLIKAVSPLTSRAFRTEEEEETLEDLLDGMERLGQEAFG